jgi:hypothetical protein
VLSEEVFVGLDLVAVVLLAFVVGLLALAVVLVALLPQPLSKAIAKMDDPITVSALFLILEAHSILVVP